MESLITRNRFFEITVLSFISTLVGSFYIMIVLNAMHLFSKRILLFLFDNIYMSAIFTFVMIILSLFIKNNKIKILAILIGIIGLIGYYLLGNYLNPSYNI